MNQTQINLGPSLLECSNSTTEDARYDSDHGAVAAVKGQEMALNNTHEEKRISSQLDHHPYHTKLNLLPLNKKKKIKMQKLLAQISFAKSQKSR